MATRSGPNKLKAPRLGGGIMVDTYRGKVRVRAWPKPRGKNQPFGVKLWNAWFKDTAAKLKYADGRAVDWAYQQAKGTPLYPRDILARCMTKGMFTILDPERGELTPRPLGLYSVSFQGMRLVLTSNQSLPINTWTKIAWESVVFDSAAAWNAAAPTRITIPPGVNIARITGSIRWTGSAATRQYLNILRNNTDEVAGTDLASTPWGAQCCDTGPLDVVAGDYFELRSFPQASRTAAAIDATNFCVEYLDISHAAP